MILLRPYQERAISALRTHVCEGRKRIILTCPTGGGKTVLAAAIIHSARTNFNAKILFLVHRLELIDQTISQLARWGVTDVGVMRADDKRTDASHPIQVATVQTLARRKLPEADIVFDDECHHSVSDSRKRLLDAYPEATIIGLTATPHRLDGKPLGDLYEAIEPASTYSQLIEDDFIVEPIVYAPKAVTDLSEIRTRAGDYVIEELEQAMNRPHVVGNIVEEWQRRAEGRHTVVFACTVKHSLSIVERFVQAGVRAEHIDGETPEDARRACLRRLDDGHTQVVSNVGVLCEGWDQPSAKCLVLARPTKSLSLLIQQAGRVLRPWHPDGLASNPSIVPVILDHANNVSLHGLPHEDRQWSLATEPRRMPERVPYRTCPVCFAYVKKNPCELCGHLAPVQERKVREVDGNLVKRVEDERRVFFVAKVEQARNKGYKPGYAGAKYKDKYGDWPPWSWGQEAKALHAQDEIWQGRQRSRERERDYWKAQDADSIEVEIDVAPEEKLEEAVFDDMQDDLPF